MQKVAQAGERMVFAKAIIDETGTVSEAQRSLNSSMYLVADEVIPATFYLLKDWSKLLAIGVPTKHFRPEQPRVVFLDNRNYTEDGTPIDGEHRIYVPSTEAVISSSSAIRKACIEQQGLNATTAIMVLAAVGVEIALPNVIFRRFDREALSTIKRQFAEEHTNYLVSVYELASQAEGELRREADFGEIILWAQNIAIHKIFPRARLLSAKLQTMNRNFLRRAGVSFWRDGLPAIGSAAVEAGGRKLIVTGAVELLKSLSVGLSRSLAERSIPEANYILKVGTSVRKLAERDNGRDVTPGFANDSDD